MSVLCQGHKDEKLRLCFDLFDANNSGFLEVSDVYEMATTLAALINFRGEALPENAHNGDCSSSNSSSDFVIESPDSIA